MDDAEQAALVRRCQSGDTEAFRTLIEAYKNTLFGVAYLMTHDRAAAEDAVQEGLVQIWRHLPSLRDPGRIKPWLIRIVVNEVNRQFRRKTAPSLPLEAADAACDDNLPEEEAMSAERRRLIRQALSGLPREQREAVTRGIALLREADRPDQGKARAVFASLIQRYPQSRWRSTAEAFIDLIDTAEAARETDRKKQLLMEQLLTERARTLQENEQLKKTVRDLTEKAQAETQALTQENEQLKKDLQRLKALEIELEKRERMLR